MEQGNRFNKGKLKWSLVPQSAFHPMVRVLEFGAKKYFSIFAPELQKQLEKWNVKTAKKIGILEQKDYVEVVMSKNCLITIQSIREIDNSIKLSIEEETKKSLHSITRKDNKEEVLMGNLKRKEEIITILKSMESQPQNLIEENKNLVKYVEKEKPLCTQTIIMTMDNLEVCFAVSAITGLDSSMTTLLCLEKLLNISLNKDSLIVKGEHNWKKGLPVVEICESLKRHLDAFMEGEDLDPESGISHVGHIQCNAMFLAWMLQNKPELDNRFKE